MTTLTGSGERVAWTPPLARADGYALCTASEALLKGFLETELDVHAVFTTRTSAFGPILQIADREDDRAVLARNGVEIVEVAHALRGVELAAQQAFRGRRVALLLGNEEIDEVLLALSAVGRTALPDGGAICLVLEDNPFAVPTTCPRRVCRRAGLSTLEPADLGGLRDACDGVMRLSAATRRPAAMVCHVTLLRSGATLPVSPNRQVALTDHALWLRHRRVKRAADAADPLQIVRRMEANRAEHLPNPGEREQYGFLAVGAAAISVRHMLDELGLTGRVPVLKLGALDPLDDAIVGRLLTRCHHVIVVEPRPGSVAPRIVALAQALRDTDQTPARVWWDALPPAAGDVEPLGINDGLRTSLLTRRVVRLLHEVRPGLRIEERLARIPPGLATLELPRRSHGLGIAAAEESVRALIDAAAETVASAAVPGEATRGIVSDRGVAPKCDVLCTVEVWEPARYFNEAVALIGQVSRENGPRTVVVLDLGSGVSAECERYGRAVAASGTEQRLAFVAVDLNDQRAMHDALVQAASTNSLTIIVAQDGPPARYDLGKLGQAALEIDRDGFRRHQRFLLPADNACELRDPGLSTLFARGLLRGSDPLRAEPRVERSFHAGARGISLKVDLLFEQVEIVRTRPPAAIEALRESVRLAPPKILHASQGLWRAHLAGFRGDGPGAAGRMIAEAGRAMRFRVEWTHLGVAIGPGRRAWSQLMFTRLDEPGGEAAEFPSVTVQVPYGEADLVLGLDAVETIRAIATDQQLRVASPAVTAIVANSGMLEDQIDQASTDAIARLSDAVEPTTMADRRVVEDLAAEVRSTFLTDRPLDLVLVGIAFQRGFIPVSIEALEMAARRLETHGFARSFEAFQLGRIIGARDAALGSRGFDASAQQRAFVEASRIARQASADRQLGGRRDRKRGTRLRSAIAEGLSALGESGDSREDRTSLRDYAAAMRRCEMWGGLEYAMKYGSMVRALVGDGSSAESRELARLSILPLAEVFLIRDVWYISTLATSIDQSHRLRSTLGVRLARGDEISRRYLHRADLRLGSKRWVVEFRSSDWPDRILHATMPWVPLGMRGSPTQRGLRQRVSELFERASREPARVANWLKFAANLNAHALDGSLRSLETSAIDQIAGECEC